MTPLGTIQSTNARIVLVVALCLLTGWALALIKQSQHYVPDQIPAPNVDDLVNKRIRLIEATPQSLLERFYRELEVSTRRLDPTGAGPLFATEVAVVLYPRCEAPLRLIDQLVEHVRAGGRLVVFTETPTQLLERFGLATSRLGESLRTAETACGSVEGMHVTTSLGPSWVQVAGTGPIVPLLRRGGEVVAGLLGSGRGSVTVVTTRISDYDWIEHGDNAVFLANLVLGPGGQGPDAAVPTVRIADYDAQLLRLLYAVDTEIARRWEEARRLWKYDSLWSLIKANPVSAGLLQLVLALVIFAITRARRLGDPLPERLVPTSTPELLKARANLFAQAGVYRLALSRAARHTRQWLSLRLGLPTGTGPGGDLQEQGADVIAKACAAISTKARDRFLKFSTHVTKACAAGSTPDADQLAQVWKLIDELRKEFDSGTCWPPRDSGSPARKKGRDSR